MAPFYVRVKKKGMVMKTGLLSIFLAGFASVASAQQIVKCGGNFDNFKANFGKTAVQSGVSPEAVNAVLGVAQQRGDVLKLDRSQASFKQTFLEFSGRTVSSGRMQIGAQKMRDYNKVFRYAQQKYGVQPEVITTFWAMETDFGVNQGNIHTVSALATLAHDCRRPELFQPQLLGAMRLTERGAFDPQNTVGAWAGEIGMVQMLPDDILRLGVDGDGDGKVDLRRSPTDAILSAANMLRQHGWRANEPWIQEVKVPNNEAWNYSGLARTLKVGQWQALGVVPRSGTLPNGNLPASLVAPQGRFGPVFLTYPNYRVFTEWNKSFIYSLSAAYMATRLGGAPRYDAGNPEAALSSNQIVSLQNKLARRGHNVGKADGIIGAKTREAVRAEQKRLGMVPDGWPNATLLNGL